MMPLFSPTKMRPSGENATTVGESSPLTTISSVKPGRVCGTGACAVALRVERSPKTVSKAARLPKVTNRRGEMGRGSLIWAWPAVNGAAGTRPIQYACCPATTGIFCFKKRGFGEDGGHGDGGARGGQTGRRSDVAVYPVSVYRVPVPPSPFSPSAPFAPFSGFKKRGFGEDGGHGDGPLRSLRFQDSKNGVSGRTGVTETGGTGSAKRGLRPLGSLYP